MPSAAAIVVTWTYFDELGDRAVALVEQVVRLVAGALDAGDLLVQVGDLRASAS